MEGVWERESKRGKEGVRKKERVGVRKRGSEAAECEGECEGGREVGREGGREGGREEVKGKAE